MYYKFFVSGTPVPQGSLKFIKGRAIHQGAERLALWRADIAHMAKLYMNQKIEGAVYVKLSFRLPVPKTVKRSRPYVRPDIDKLIRAVLDGLTGVVYDDDAQVCRVASEKVYGPKGSEGVFIEIFSME